MKIKDLLRIEEIVEKRSTPCDLLEIEQTYYSQSQQKEIKIEDMHLQHLLRVFLILLEHNDFILSQYKAKHKLTAKLKNLFGGLK